MVNKQEGLEVEQHRSRLKLERQEMEVKESFDRLRMLEMKLAMRAQNQMQNMDDKLSPIKTRNTELMRKIHTIQDQVKDSEMKNYHSYLSREKRRLRALQQRQAT